MATDKQIAANRLNAQKSTGPKTPEGRAAVRLNGVEHGLYAETLVLPGEALVVQLAMAMWRLRRLYHAEVAYCAKERKFLAKLTSEKQLDDHTLTGMAVHANRDTVSTFRRQEAALERTFYRALHELQRPHAKRPAKLALNPHLAAADTQEPENHPPAESNPPSEPTPSRQNTIQIAPPADSTPHPRPRLPTYTTAMCALVLHPAQFVAARDDLVGRAPWPAADPLVGLLGHVHSTLWLRLCCLV